MHDSGAVSGDKLEIKNGAPSTVLGRILIPRLFFYGDPVQPLICVVQ